MGLLIVYDVGDKSSIISLHRNLFGRIASLKDKRKYYYPGILHDINYFKIKDGCYYIDKDIQLSDDVPVRTYRCNLDIDLDKFETGKDHWKKL